MSANAKLPGPIALAAVSGALGNVGVTEQGGENRGKAIAIYLASVGITVPAPWCAAFVYFRLFTAAKLLGLELPEGFPASGYTPDWAHWAKRSGLWIPVAEIRAGRATIRKGDLCLFYFSRMGRIAHIGIVTGPMVSGSFPTAEGNTSSGTGVNRDGDGVFARSRRLLELGALGGFIRCPF